MQLQITKTNYDSSDFGEDIVQHEKTLLEYSSTQAVQNAGINMPVELDHFNAYIKNHVEISTQQKINHNQAEFLPHSGETVAKAEQEAGDKKVKELTGRVNDEKHKLGQLENAKKAATPDLKKIFWGKVAMIIVTIMAIFEGGINYGSLRNGSFSVGIALAISICLAVALAFTTHIVGEYIKRSENKKQLIIRSAIVLIPAFVLFFVLASLRVKGQNTASTLSYQTGASAIPPASQHSALVIAFISFFIYALALLIAVRYAQSKKQKEQQRAYDKACRELSEVNNTISGLEKEIEQVKADTMQKVNNAIATWEFAQLRERHLLSIAKKALEIYAATNLRHRTDSICPSFFSSMPECTFTTFFQTSKTN